MPQDVSYPQKQTNTSSRGVVSILLWVAVSTCWLVSIFTVIEEMCLATACRDTAGFTFFGFNMGLFGIGYFSLVLLSLWLRKKHCRLESLLFALVFAGSGAELRLLWIQKYVIGGWCPLCVTISCALFVAAVLLLAGKLHEMKCQQVGVGGLLKWGAFLALSIATGLTIAVAGVQPLV